MALGGLGLALIGFRKKDMLDAGIGGCFIGSALFGYLSRSDNRYAWVQLLFAIAMAVLVIAKFRAVRKKNRGQDPRQ